MKKYDAILVVENDQILEDERVYGRKLPGAIKGMNGLYNTDDPKMYYTYSFGNAVKSALSNMGNGFSCKVTDFKKWVVVEVTHHNHITGKSASKTYLIVFQDKGDGIVLTTHNKYRSISGADQAISYIRSTSSALQSDTQSRI
jgi:hypothetical protein